MAKYSKAKQVPLRNFTKDGQEQVLGLVVHIMEGTLEGSQSWFNNPASQASSHFGTGKDGEIRQWVDTKDRAWAQGSGNRTYLSVENEGHTPDKLTKAQIETIAQLFVWVHKTHGVPLQLAKKVGDKGLGYHAMGGAAWGGHPCPGPAIIAQLPAIVLRAKEIAGVKVDKPKPVYAPFPGVGFFRIGKEHKLVEELGKALIRAGYKAQYTPTKTFTRADIKAYAWWQRKLGYSGAAADGYPGAKSWAALKVSQPK